MQKKRDMEIKRENFRFNRIVNPYDVIDDSALFSMTQEDIDSDAIVSGEKLEDGDDMIVFQNTVEPHQNERYCYIKINTRIGTDGLTRMITINKIIVDGGLIDRNLFAQIFTILLQQEDNEHPNRIVVTNGYNERFRGRIVEVANNIANRICGLYNTYTNANHQSYTIQ